MLKTFLCLLFLGMGITSARSDTYSQIQPLAYQNLTAAVFTGLNDTSEDTIFTYSPTSGQLVQEAVLDLTNLATTITATIRVKRTFSGSAALVPAVLGIGLTLANALAGTCIWTLATDADVIRIPLGYVMGSGDSVRITVQCSLAESGARNIPYVLTGIK